MMNELIVGVLELECVIHGLFSTHQLI